MKINETASKDCVGRLWKLSNRPLDVISPVRNENHRPPEDPCIDVDLHIDDPPRMLRAGESRLCTLVQSAERDIYKVR